MKQIQVTDFRPAEYERTVYVADLQEAVPATLEEVLAPGYFAHVSKLLKKWDRIEVRGREGAWFAELLVLYVGGTDVRCRVLKHEVLEKPRVSTGDVDPHSEYEIKFRGAAKWGVIRRADRQLMVSERATRADAEMWLDNHLHELTA